MAQEPIYSANNTPLSNNSGTVPNVNDVIGGWFQPMTFEVVTKATVNFQVVETTTPVNFLGVWQPTSPRKLEMKDIGQRKWGEFTVHADPSLELVPDDVIVYLGIQYRVMAKLNYTLYGYNEYHLLRDFTGSGPTVE